MYISTFYGVVKQNNGYFKIFYPVYSNGDISPVVNASEFNSFSTAHNQADLAYLDLQSALANVDNISVYGNYELLYENNNYLIQQVALEVNLTQSSDPDYTNILTDINTNLSNLNTNITNKNNQSDIVSCLNNIFGYARRDGSFASCVKDTSLNVSTPGVIIDNMGICNLLYHIYCMLSSIVVSKSSLSSDVSNRALDNISKKLSLTIPDNEDNIWNCGISRRLAYLCQILSGKSITNASSMRSDSLLKEISDKLANTNDLHTISQAIDLISTAIAQSPTTDTTNLEQGLTEIKESIESKDNVLLVDGTQNFIFRKEEDDPDQ